eukprot:TRINITY_DN1257_c0_g1_i1.p1 TRINITY_DN1257_c0_g1~~TRINITY_DN1257_c0_g1_i1.p1  ORF type:complete len:639 (-),score=55.27 TRINITY_DN1257_c0_g1_i1:23-1939(-)
MATAPSQAGLVSSHSSLSNALSQSAPSLSNPIFVAQPIRLPTDHVMNISVRGPLENTLDSVGSLHVSIELGGRTWKGVLMSHSSEPLTSSRGEAMEIDSLSPRIQRVAEEVTSDPNSPSTRASPVSAIASRQDDAMDVSAPEERVVPVEKQRKLKPVDLRRFRENTAAQSAFLRKFGRSVVEAVIKSEVTNFVEFARDRPAKVEQSHNTARQSQRPQQMAPFVPATPFIATTATTAPPRQSQAHTQAQGQDRPQAKAQAQPKRIKLRVQPRAASAKSPRSPPPAATTAMTIEDDDDVEPSPILQPTPAHTVAVQPPATINSDGFVNFTQRHWDILKVLSKFKQPLSYLENGEWRPLPLPPPNPSVPIFVTTLDNVPALVIPLTDNPRISSFRILVAWFYTAPGVIETKGHDGSSAESLLGIMSHALRHYYMMDTKARQLFIDCGVEKGNAQWTRITGSTMTFPFLPGTEAPAAIHRATLDDKAPKLLHVLHRLARTPGATILVDGKTILSVDELISAVQPAPPTVSRSTGRSAYQPPIQHTPAPQVTYAGPTMYSAPAPQFQSQQFGAYHTPLQQNYGASPHTNSYGTHQARHLPNYMADSHYGHQPPPPPPPPPPPIPSSSGNSYQQHSQYYQNQFW